MHFASTTGLVALPVGAALVDKYGTVWQKRETTTTETQWYPADPNQVPHSDVELGQKYGPFQQLHIPTDGTSQPQLAQWHPSGVNRVEVIDATGRAYVTYNTHSVRVVLQDDRQTLKIFHPGQPVTAPYVALGANTLAQFIHDHENWAAKQLPDPKLSKVPAATTDLANKIVTLLRGDTPNPGN